MFYTQYLSHPQIYFLSQTHSAIKWGLMIASVFTQNRFPLDHSSLPQYNALLREPVS